MVCQGLLTYCLKKHFLALIFGAVFRTQEEVLERGKGGLHADGSDWRQPGDPFFF